MERTVVVAVSVVITVLGVALLVALIGSFRGEFRVGRIDCPANPCVDSLPRCEGDVLVACGFDGNGCPVLARTACEHGCGMLERGASCNA